MPYLSIDHLILVAFLLLTLIIGLRAGRGIKNMQGYATANKMFGTGALVLTWLATDVAGETVLDMANAVRGVGIIQPLVVFGGWGIALLMQALSLSLLDELFTLFPARATTKHLGLAISQLLAKAQGGDLLYAVNDLPEDPYTEFILTIPPTSLKHGLSA